LIGDRVAYIFGRLFSLAPLEDEECMHAEGPDGKPQHPREHVGAIENNPAAERAAVAGPPGKCENHKHHQPQAGERINCEGKERSQRTAIEARQIDRADAVENVNANGKQSCGQRR